MLHDPSRGAVEPLAGYPRFTKIADLGRGSFGFVQKAKGRIVINGQPVDREVAIKFIPRGNKITEHVEREVLNHWQLTHHHIVQFREVILTPSHLGIVMDLAPGGTLRAHMNKQKGGRLPEEQARFYFQQLVIAMEYCHRLGICIRDIKPENTLLDKHGCVRISDFGASKTERYHSKPNTKCGTHPFMAPEVMHAEAGYKYDGKKADVWSAGVMLYNMLTGAYPFATFEDLRLPQAELIDKIFGRMMEGDFPKPKAISGCCDLLEKMLTLDVKDRISAADIYSHAWFQAGLPPGALSMNDEKASPAGSQSLQEIKELLRQARNPPAAPSAPPAPQWDPTLATFDMGLHSGVWYPVAGGGSNNAAQYNTVDGMQPFEFGYMGNGAPDSAALNGSYMAGYPQQGDAGFGPPWQ